MELATPITIHWDLPPDAADTGFLLRIAADIVDCHPLMLQLTSTASLPDPGLLAVLERFRGGAIAVSLTIPLAAWHDMACKTLGQSGVKEILLAVERTDDLLARDGAWGGVAGLSCAVNSENWRELPTLLAFCRRQGLGRLVLPMQRLYNGESPFYLTAAEQRELADVLAAAGGAGGIGLTIHDPFLWRAFNPGVPFPQGGCQAANTMLSIASDGGVFPCPTLPLRLGAIGSSPLKEIAASAAKKEFRRRLLDAPAACRECAILAECRGGCRGRAYVMQGSLEEVDPACR